MSDPQRVVFIGGAHRSGTSLLARVLREHPLVSGFSGTGVPEDEGQHLQSVLPTALGFPTLPHRARRSLRESVLAARGGAGKFALRPWGHLTETSPLASDECARTLRNEWGRHWDASRPFLLEKSPPNVVRTRLLRRLFPESLFVIMVRHPVAVAFSTKRLRRTPLSLHLLLKHWVVCHELLLDDIGQLDGMMVIRYEHLVARPAEVLAALSAFLGLREPALSARPRPLTNEPHLRRWHRLGESAFSGWYVRALARRFESRVRRLGYSLQDLDLVDTTAGLDVCRPAACAAAGHDGGAPVRPGA